MKKVQVEALRGMKMQLCVLNVCIRPEARKSHEVWKCFTHPRFGNIFLCLDEICEQVLFYCHNILKLLRSTKQILLDLNVKTKPNKS